MSSTTASVKPTNRLLEMTYRFASRLPSLPNQHKRPRQETIDHFTSNVSSVLFLDGRPQYKRSRIATTRRSIIEVDDETKTQEERNSTDENTNEETRSSASVETGKKVPSLQKKVSPISDVTLAQDEVLRRQEELNVIKKEIVALEHTKQQVLQEVVDVLGAYQYGLNKINALTDLSATPDAIMPGNF